MFAGPHGHLLRNREASEFAPHSLVQPEIYLFLNTFMTS